MSVRMRLIGPAAVLFALLTACGATGSNGNKVASLADPTASSSAQQASDGKTDEDKIREFTKCMRDHGVDIPEPTQAPHGGSTNGGKGGTGIVVQGNGGDNDKINKANDACKSLLPNGGQPPKVDAQQLDEMRKMAQCMREHGANVPDPDPNNPGIMVDPKDGQQIDPQVMEKAAKACAPDGGAGVHVEQGPAGGTDNGPHNSTGGGQ
jgi:hypothetical protein